MVSARCISDGEGGTLFCPPHSTPSFHEPNKRRTCHLLKGLGLRCSVGISVPVPPLPPYSAPIVRNNGHLVHVLVGRIIVLDPIVLMIRVFKVEVGLRALYLCSGHVV